jgi:hypothetical protein
MQELAPGTVGTVQVFMVLLALFGLVVLGYMLLPLELMLTMRKGTLKEVRRSDSYTFAKFAVSVNLPIPTDFRFVLNLKTMDIVLHVILVLETFLSFRRVLICVDRLLINNRILSVGKVVIFI